MSKFTVYSLFSLKFLLSLLLITWTIYMTTTAGKTKLDDNVFLSKHNNIKDNYNLVVVSNEKFNNLFDFELTINNKIISGIQYSDIFLAQRNIIHDKSKQNKLKVGKNDISISLKDKKSGKNLSFKCEILISKTSDARDDIRFRLNSIKNSKKFEIKKKSFLNITGKVNTDNFIGYFFIKTTAK